VRTKLLRSVLSPMRRKIQRGSGLYQVDLIAALFSGYIVVWLATSSAMDKQEEGVDPLYGTLSIFRGVTGNGTDVVAVPALKVCAPSTIVHLVTPVYPNAKTCRVTEVAPRTFRAEFERDTLVAFEREIRKFFPGVTRDAARTEKAVSWTIPDIAFKAGVKFTFVGDFVTEDGQYVAPQQDTTTNPFSERSILVLSDPDSIDYVTGAQTLELDYDPNAVGRSIKYNYLSPQPGKPDVGYSSFLSTAALSSGWTDTVQLCFFPDGSYVCFSGMRASGVSVPIILSRDRS
jgi:hypothetical protein